MGADLDPGVDEGKTISSNRCSNPVVEQDGFHAVTGIILRVEHRRITREYELPMDVRQNGNYWWGSRDTSRQRGKVVLKRAHRVAMEAKANRKQKTLATYCSFQVGLQRSQPSSWSRYYKIIRRVVAGNGDSRKVFRRCQD